MKKRLLTQIISLILASAWIFSANAQKFEAASFSLNATSLYFTCMANGNSRFYSVEKFYRYLESAGFSVEQRLDNLGVGHTLLICTKREQ